MDRIQNFNSPVVENISKVIKRKGLIQKVVAERSGFTQQSFCDILNGRRILKISETKKIADALQIPIDDLFKAD